MEQGGVAGIAAVHSAPPSDRRVGRRYFSSSAGLQCAAGSAPDTHHRTARPAVALRGAGYGKLPFEAQYEPRCYLKGEVPTRAHNWHDLFNALVWLTFPATKAVINARHYHALTDAMLDKGAADSTAALSPQRERVSARCKYPAR